MQNTNRLVNSSSPYLLQHAHNPVDWYPWGEEAFAAAKEQDKPIFLSIGYSTCHWCHVMERESFMDSAVAAEMNKNFINIKVDREERPDVDNVYMSVCQMLTGQGGWPLTVVMTPERKPFFAATYLPPTSRGNRPGVIELTKRIGEMWQTQREVLLADANRVVSVLQDSLAQEPGSFNESVIEATPDAMLAQFDTEYGGFASARNNFAPKFPSLHNISFLLSQKLTLDTAWQDRIELTLTEVMSNGIVDQLGGGIHRYSVDREWHLPHFEKMLYDQAWAVRAYAEASVVYQQPRYVEFVDEIVEYIDRDLRHESGAYYAAENADSEGEEGKFYVWSWSDLESVLGEDLQDFSKLSGVHPQGNFTDEATGQATGLNIVARPTEKMTQAEEQLWNSASEKLFQARAKRVRPSLDDKILSAWNGYMIMALARAGYLLDKPEYIQKGEDAFAFIEREVSTPKGELATSFRKGKVSETHTLEDYAGMLAASIELYNATGKPHYLQYAKNCIRVAVNEFWDESHGGFFLGAKDAKDLIVQSKDGHDGAMPSANSLMTYYVNKYVKITGDVEYTHIPEATLKVFAADIQQYPSGYTFMLLAASEVFGESVEVVLAGDRNDELLQKTNHLMRSEPFANRVVLYNYPEYSKELGVVAPFVEGYASSGSGQVYVCRNYACMLPAETIEEVQENLR